ncbi:polysaccharide biosynthesis/export family protein [Coraliomargarita sp. W4R72]
MTILNPKIIRLLLLLLGLVGGLRAQDADVTANVVTDAANVDADAANVDAAEVDPTQMSLLDDDWELKAGDRLVYQVLEEREDPLLLAINGNGDLLVPLIGTIPATGKTSKELAYEVKETLEKDFFYRATVVISQREEDRNRGRITVIGEVKRQGEQLIPVDSPLTLSEAILQGGGFTLYANRTNVSVVSEGEDESRIELDLGAMMERGDLSQDPILKAGDVVIVAREDQANSQVYVLGAVGKPGLYSILGSKFTLSQVILMADGFTRFAKSNKVRHITTDASGEKIENVVDVGKVLEGGDRSGDPIVKPGDMVIVDEKMISFTG